MVISAAALFLCASCFQDPILEKLSIEFHPDSTVTVTSTVEFLDPTDFDSRALRARVELVRAEFDHQTDAWSRRFSGVSFQREKSSVEKTLGSLNRLERSGVLHPAQLQRFFADTDLSITVIDGDGWRELAIVPGSSTRSTVQSAMKSCAASTCGAATLPIIWPHWRNFTATPIHIPTSPGRDRCRPGRLSH